MVKPRNIIRADVYLYPRALSDHYALAILGDGGQIVQRLPIVCRVSACTVIERGHIMDQVSASSRAALIRAAHHAVGARLRAGDWQ